MVVSKKIVAPFLASLALFGLVGACEGSPTIVEQARFEKPQGALPVSFDDTIELEISASGALMRDGQEIEPHAVAEALGPNEETQDNALDKEDVVTLDIVPPSAPPVITIEPHRIPLAISADGNARHAQVVGHLSSIGFTGEIYFRGLEQFREFDRPTGEAAGMVRGFAGPTGEYDLPVSVSYSAESDQCVVALNNQAMSAEELYDQSFIWLDTIVVNSGGVEAVLANPDIIDNLVARIQAQAGTPWRCVAGAIFRTHVSGWPFVQLEVISASQD